MARESMRERDRERASKRACASWDGRQHKCRSRLLGQPHAHALAAWNERMHCARARTFWQYFLSRSLSSLPCSSLLSSAQRRAGSPGAAPAWPSLISCRLTCTRQRAQGTHRSAAGAAAAPAAQAQAHHDAACMFCTTARPSHLHVLAVRARIVLAAPHLRARTHTNAHSIAAVNARKSVSRRAMRACKHAGSRTQQHALAASRASRPAPPACLAQRAQHAPTPSGAGRSCRGG